MRDKRNYKPRPSDPTNFRSLFRMTEYFKDDETCRRYLAEKRWHGNVVCPFCGHEHCYTRSDGRFRCPDCQNNFSVTKGTIFENTKIPLRKWFITMYLISSHKKGISSHQLARDAEICQKTAWYILQKVRRLFEQDDQLELFGDIELDESYIGGKEKYKHSDRKTESTQGRSTKTKSAVFGLVKRKGHLVAKHVCDTKGNTLSPIIRHFVKPGSRIYTDEYIGYRSLHDSEYTHAIVRHNAKQFVDGDIYTNTIEGFWSHLKRTILGIHHFVSAKHLQRYVDEAVFRWNTRDQAEGDRFHRMFSRYHRVIRYTDVKAPKIVAAA